MQINFMKHIFLLLTLIISTVQANFDTTFRNNLLINPNTNPPYTGNIEILNNDWGKDAVELLLRLINNEESEVWLTIAYRKN